MKHIKTIILVMAVLFIVSISLKLPTNATIFYPSTDIRALYYLETSFADFGDEDFNGMTEATFGLQHGKIDNGVTFSGDQKGQVPTALHPNTASSTFSIWFRYLPSTSTQLLWFGELGNNTYQFFAYINTSGQLCLAAGFYGPTCAGSFNDSMWHNLTFRTSFGELTNSLWVDGQSFTTTQIWRDEGLSVDCFFFGNGGCTSPNSPFTGDIDEIYFFDRVLSNAEVVALYNSGFAERVGMLEPEENYYVTIDFPRQDDKIGISKPFIQTSQETNFVVTTKWLFNNLDTGDRVEIQKGTTTLGVRVFDNSEDLIYFTNGRWKFSVILYDYPANVYATSTSIEFDINSPYPPPEVEVTPSPPPVFSEPPECSIFNLSSCFSNVMAWLFVPTTSTIASFTEIELGTRFPFSYFYSLRSVINQLNVADTNDFPEITFTAGMFGSITLFSLASIIQYMGQPLFDTFRGLMIAGIWLLFALYIYHRFREII